GEPRGHAPGVLVVRMSPRHAGPAEQAHRGPDGSEGLEALDELAHDLEDDPGVLGSRVVHGVRIGRRLALLEEPLEPRARVALRARAGGSRRGGATLPPGRAAAVSDSHSPPSPAPGRCAIVLL